MSKLSQNFLHDKSFVDKFVYYVFSMGLTRPIIEVGCGKGIISAKVNPDVCIEIDVNLLQYLRSFSPVLSDARYLPVFRGSIVSSLPYSITRDFFLEVSELNDVNKMLLILQKDFVDKILEYPSYISFLLNYYYLIRPMDVIPPDAFSPKPKVYSQIVYFVRRRKYDDRVSQVIECVSRFRNKKVKKAAELCNIKSDNERRVRDYKPWEILELLSSMDINSA
ncbi:MAG: 16S ribosomal RNA methyltransferase A [Candidatus Aramenus sp.]|jgi:16S rRNA (adenine1518-N6/adenine1519-N6)-dimethyltransferase|nr:16S ribosomal RNA methyltransferase A [Candidatus Aramenus sp.]